MLHSEILAFATMQQVIVVTTSAATFAASIGVFVVRLHAYQSINFKPNWITRPSLAEPITPNELVPRVVPDAPKFG